MDENPLLCYNDRMNGSFQHLTNFIDRKLIRLGWLAGISAMETDKAVTTDWHWHETTEMLFCIRGETNYEFRDRSRATLCPGSYLVIPAGCEHRVTNAIDEPGRRIGLNLRTSYDRTRKFAVFTASDYRRFLRILGESACCPAPCPPNMKHDLAELDKLIRQSRLTPAEYGYLRILCCGILYAAVRPPEANPSSPAKIMDEAVKWLGNHFTEKVSVDRLAAYMGYSRARLFTLFREHTGLSPNNYLMRLRIGRSKELLSAGSQSVKDVALDCGFPDDKYFCRLFKRQTGMSPLSYRREHAAAS